MRMMVLLVATLLMIGCDEATQEKDLLIGSWRLGDPTITDPTYEEVLTFHADGRLSLKAVRGELTVSTEGEWRYEGNVLVMRYYDPVIGRNTVTVVITRKTTTRLCWKTLRHPESEDDPEYDAEYDETCFNRV